MLPNGDVLAGTPTQQRHPDHDLDTLAAQAKEQERLSEAQLDEAGRHDRRDHVLTLAVTFVQVAIAIAALSIITRRERWPWYGSMALAAVGLLTAAFAYL